MKHCAWNVFFRLGVSNLGSPHFFAPLFVDDTFSPSFRRQFYARVLKMLVLHFFGRDGKRAIGNFVNLLRFVFFFGRQSHEKNLSKRDKMTVLEGLWSRSRLQCGGGKVGML